MKVFILRLVAEYATRDSDPPDPDLRWIRKESGGKGFYGGDVLTAGLNCTRGHAAWIIGSLIGADPKRVAVLLDPLGHALDDPSAAVVSCAVRSLLFLSGERRKQAIAPFVQAVQTHPSVLATQPAEEFLRYAAWEQFDAAAPVIDSMLSSPDAEIVRIGARQACLAAFRSPAAGHLRDRVTAGTVPMRLGAAEVFATNISDNHVGAECREQVARLLDDEDQAVCREISRAFQDWDDGQLRECKPLAIKFVDSRAFAIDPDPLLHSLQDTETPDADIVLACAERAVQSFGRDAGDLRTARAMSARMTAELVVRVYGQAESPQLKIRCLDLIDEMERQRFYGIRTVLRPNR